MDFEGKVALVTGGSLGIGTAISLDLAQNGADVALTYRRHGEEAKRIVEQIGAMSRKGKEYKVDVSDFGAVQKLVDDVVKEFGRLDILVNGWGGGEAELQALQQQELDLTVMRINDDNGIAMAEAIKLDQLNLSQRIPHIFAGDIELLHKGASSSVINQLKQKAFRLSGQPGEIDK